MVFLAVDIGTSFIKSAVVDLQDMKVHRVRRKETPRIASEDPAVRELSLSGTVRAVREMIEENIGLFPLSGIVFSTQMHGALFRGCGSGIVSNYITWQDTRTQIPGQDGKSSVERTAALLGPELLRRVGNRIGSGHTAAQMLAWKERTGCNPERVSLLGDAVIEELCGHPVPVHETQACATGLYDVYKREWSGDVLRALGLTGVRLPDVEREGKPDGSYETAGRRIPVYAALGDQQAAILGAFPGRDELLINIGTGAQVIWPGESRADAETRLTVEGERFRTISGLPGGRSLNVLFRFFADAGRELFGIEEIDEGELWRRMVRLSGTRDEGLPGVRMTFDHEGGGGISGINEENLTAGRLMAGACENMADHYERACRQLCGSLDGVRGVILGGGVGRRFARLKETVKGRLCLPVRYAPYEEDVLAGLARVSACCAGLYPDIERTREMNGILQFTED